MQKTTIRLGYCPTRRDVFSREEAMRYGRVAAAPSPDVEDGAKEAADNCPVQVIETED